MSSSWELPPECGKPRTDAPSGSRIPSFPGPSAKKRGRGLGRIGSRPPDTSLRPKIAFLGPSSAGWSLHPLPGQATTAHLSDWPPLSIKSAVVSVTTAVLRARLLGREQRRVLPCLPVDFILVPRIPFFHWASRALMSPNLACECLAQARHLLTRPRAAQSLMQCLDTHRHRSTGTRHNAHRLCRPR